MKPVNTAAAVGRLIPGLYVKPSGIVALDAAGTRFRIRLNMKGSVMFRGAGVDGASFRGGLLSDFARLGIISAEIFDQADQPLGTLAP